MVIDGTVKESGSSELTLNQPACSFRSLSILSSKTFSACWMGTLARQSHGCRPRMAKLQQSQQAVRRQST
ncbi:hypothetical protein CEE69_24160 [Rhodopirellula bahusiensis]|uniref:Uncharacterized protein n=1 Tax=Rhodopirellula bahusiensis TaxID=2014065 RepID=A0A2G1W101_9BACT|nr:hypothetical protein CEE69_24160 [Rhodopirellula bahusiensis]